jgi:Mn-containing catalase
MSGMKKKLTSAKTANDPDSRINKSLRKWNCSYEPDGTPIMEEDKAFKYVLDKIRKEVGKDGYVSKNNPRKPQTTQQKAKVRAHQAKVDAENAAERKKDPSQGRYPKG